MKITGAQAIVKAILEQGVNTIFGYPGGQVIPLYDALYDAPLKNVLTVHEQGAIHAADGYARASGDVGVCIATSGPGATNIVTGLATAYLDSIPIVAICGQVSTIHIGRDAFQEVDIVSVSSAVTKHNICVSRVEEIVGALREAFAIARSGRPGPVLVDIPADLQKALVEWQDMPKKSSDMVKKEPEVDLGLIKEAARMILNAEQPVIMVGGGAIQASCSEAIEKLVAKTNIPVISTLMGLGAFDSYSSQFLGMSGMHGQKSANLAINNADLLIVVGSRLSERVTGDRSKYIGKKKIVQFDIDPSEIDKNVAVNLSVVANLADSLKRLADFVNEDVDFTSWWAKIHEWQKEDDLKLDDTKLQPYWVMQELNRVFKEEETIFVTDVGQNQMWAAQALKFQKPRTHITSGGCGTMGFSMPAVIGVKMAKPDKRVVQIVGDGGFKMTGMELFTAVNEELPMINIVLNNQSLGMVKQWQHVFHDKRYSSTQLKPFDFMKFAQSCGADGCKVDSQEGFTQALEVAKKSKKPYLIEVAIEPDAMVLPMVAPGAPIDEFVDVSV